MTTVITEQMPLEVSQTNIACRPAPSSSSSTIMTDLAVPPPSSSSSSSSLGSSTNISLRSSRSTAKSSGSSKCLDKTNKSSHKKSGVRTKFFVEALRRKYYDLKFENDMLRHVVVTKLDSDNAEKVLKECTSTRTTTNALFLPSSSNNDKIEELMPNLNIVNNSHNDDGYSDDGNNSLDDVSLLHL